MKYRLKYFGCKVYLHHYKDSPGAINSGLHMFSIMTPDGVLHRYGGIPNKCDTKHQAPMRAWWRCKWFADGSYNQHYA